MQRKLNNIEFISFIYLSNKHDSDAKIEILKNHFFRNCTKNISEEYKLSKVIEYIRELNSLLFMPAMNDIEDLEFINSYCYSLSDRDYEEINKVAESINNRYLEHNDKQIKQCKYQKVFEDYARYIHPSHSKRGDWKHSEIDEAKSIQNEYKDLFPELFNLIREVSTKFNTSVDLVVYVCSKLLVLEKVDDKTYQLNLRNNMVLNCIKEYYKLTNIEKYKNEYEKISFIRSILNNIAQYCFKDMFVFEKDSYQVRKYHSRLLAKVKNEQIELQDSKSFNNYFITFNNLTNLLRKSVNYFHYTKNKNNNKLLYKEGTSPPD